MGEPDRRRSPRPSGCPTSHGARQCQLAIVLDGVVQSSPVIEERIAGSAQISGSFTQKSAADLANVLKYGALPIAFDKSEVVTSRRRWARRR